MTDGASLEAGSAIRDAASGRPGRSGRAATLHWLLQNVVWFWLLGLIVIFGLFNPYFFTINNMQNIMVQATVLGLLALAISLPLLVAEIDLSIAANMGFSSVLGALAIGHGAPWWAGILIGIAAGAAVGLFNGLCVTRLRMVSLIETLAMMIILQGALLAITEGNTIANMPDAYTWIGQASIATWPIMPLVFVACLAAVAVMLRRTVLGRSIYAVGGNAAASAAAGIRVERIKIIAFTVSGLLAGIAGYLLAAWQMAITSNQGEGFLLYSIAAPIIGGVSVFGGRGSVVGILGGVLLLTVIQAGLAVVSFPSFYVGMIGGLMIFVAVAIDAVRVRMSAGR
ncbi:ABC transporter permease [Labrys wisconsinensis]|uniref:Xylose transport system permease protein XylH n=1 Tax=Labrys wisconsinensis TaxID=425677 RepID=A0ABU0JDK4_9HYPH|nr:ABC transporter permease [Labrys wisconsinensis]MDQ0471344.1 simple sugar transport system permease protein/ribose transport system permease protein [Labrys wisconsinensis]